MPVIVELAISEDVVSEDAEIPDETEFQAWADCAFLGDDDVIASLQIVGRDEMQALNNDYRGIDKPTNVLSFPIEIPEEVDINILGDLVFCADVIKAEAGEQCKSLSAHWAHMLVHGMLHLQGYDHIDDDEAEQMEMKEVDILQQLGFSNPYQYN